MTVSVNTTWLISGLYRPQSINDNNFNKDFIDTFDKISTLYDNVLILGDINYDMLSEHKGAPLKNVCDIFDFVNLVKSPTCFTIGAPATLNDFFLTNRSTFCQNIQNFNCGLSDVHNIISVQIKGTTPRINKKFVEYRSFKNFDQEIFLNDLEQKNLNSIVDKCDNVNSAYENFE